MPRWISSSYHAWPTWGLLLAAHVTAASLAAVERSSVDSKPDQASLRLEPLRLVDPVLPFVPLRPRSAAQDDNLESATRYAHGRLLFHRQEFATALRQYQRAFRLQPRATTILAEIVPLAVQLNRPSVAAHYAMLGSAGDKLEPDLLRQLALYLTDSGQYAGAIHLYEWVLQQQMERPPDVGVVLINYELGRLYYLTQEYQKSASAFEIVRSALSEPAKFGMDETLRKLLRGDATMTYAVMGESFLKAGRPLGAAALFKQANEAKPNQPLLAFNLARAAAAQGKTQEALKTLDEYFRAKLSTAGTQPYQLLEQLLQQGHPDEQARVLLKERLEELRRADANNTALAYFLAGHYQARGDVENAQRLYAQLITRAPTLQGFRALVDIYRGNNQVDKLVDLLGQVVARVGSLEPLGNAQAALLKNADLVADILATARKRTLGNRASLSPSAAIAAALTAIDSGEFTAAEEFFEFALRDEQANAAQVLMSWGVELFLANQFESSANVFRRALREQLPAQTKALLHFHLAGALAMGGQTDDAYAVADTLAKTEGAPLLFQRRRCWVLYHAGSYARAEVEYRKLLERFASSEQSPDNREILREIRFTLSNLCVTQDRLGDAEEWLQQILDEFPQDVGAMNDLGYLWADQNKHLHRALEMVTRAVESEPENVAYRDSLGWTLYRLGRYAESIEALEKAADSEKPDGIILDHLGDAHTKAGNVSAAVTTWEKAIQALQRDDESETIAAIQTKIQQHREK